MDAWRPLLEQMLARVSERQEVPPEIARAFSAIPRHLFLPGVAWERVYSGDAIPTRFLDGKPISSSSEVSLMIAMLRHLKLRPGLNVLEVGAGTGYNAAILAELVGPNGRVTTIEIEPEICAAAKAHLEAAGHPEVRVVLGDGGRPPASDGPYDRIIVTAGAYDIAPAWREQLRPGGRLVVPLWFSGVQLAAAFVREGDRLRSTGLIPCGFMRLRGAFRGTEAYLDLSRGWSIAADDPAAGTIDLLSTLLTETPREHPLEPPIQGWLFGLFLAVRDPRFVKLHRSSADGQPDADAIGLFDPSAPSLAVWVTERRPTGWAVRLRSFGSPARVEALKRHWADWQALGAPDERHVELTAHPAPLALAPPEVTVVRRRFHDYTIRWRPP
ncbi:MAG TPA: methyltransferase domain-containing protein [Limnochordia bacterium]